MNNGPVFESGPGWGARLAGWSKRNILYIVPATALIIVIAIVSGTAGKHEGGTPEISRIPSGPASTSSLPALVQTVQKGDSYTILSRRAITAAIKDLSPMPTKGARLFAETKLATIFSKQPLVVGGTVTYGGSDISNALAAFDTLTAKQKASWEALARNIKF